MAGVAVSAAGGVGDEGLDVTENKTADWTRTEGRTKREYNIASMVILALETVTRSGSLAVWKDGMCRARAGDSAASHAERLPADVIDWLAADGLELADVDLFVVVSGPGSFTGIRVGMAAIQGFSLAGHRRTLGVPTLDALTAAWRLEHGRSAQVVACLDGQRREVFYAAHDVDAGEPIDSRRVLVEPAVGSPEDAAASVASRLDPARPIVIVGDGAALYGELFGARLPSAEIAASTRTLAEGAAWLATTQAERAGAPHALRPIYLRRPDVFLARERAGLAHPSTELDRCTVRRANSPADLDAVEQLQAQAFTNAWGAEAIRWELENTDVARLYVLREPGGALVAYCACWVVFDELHINSFAVDPAWRRRGIARHLLRRVIDESAASGVRSATLEVRSSNEPARKLYEGLGFQVEAVRREYYRDPVEDALILWNRAVR